MRSSIFGSIIAVGFLSPTGALAQRRSRWSGRVSVPFEYTGDLGRRPIHVVAHHAMVEELRRGHLVVDPAEASFEVHAVLRAPRLEPADQLPPGRRLEEDQHRVGHTFPDLPG